MSLTGRLQEAMFNVLWGYEANQAGQWEPGLLADLPFDRVSAIIDRIVDTALIVADKEGPRT